MPRRRKSFSSRKRSKSAPPSLPGRRGSEKRKTWANEQMEGALEAVAKGQSVSKAARDHGVPKTTLLDRTSGRVVHGVKPGPRPYLSPTEEKDLGTFLKDCAKVGYGKTRKDVLSIAQSVAQEKGLLRSERISEGWWRRFLERQSDLSLRQGDSTAHVRMDAINRETLDQYFSLLHDTLKTHHLLNKPSQLYNVDESGMPFNPRPPKVVSARGRKTKKVRYRTSGKKGQVTIVGCANAAGQTIPPMVIFDAARLNPVWTRGEVPGTKYGLSSNGWINTELFEGWLIEHFIENAVSARPLFLLLDGHSTHYQPQVIRFARDHNVIMLCLPPHTTHESQPLDVGVFAPLKSRWTQVCHDFYQANPGRTITKFNFSSLFAQAWCRAVSPSNVIAGFRRAGVYPLNKDVIVVPEPSSGITPEPTGLSSGATPALSGNSSGITHGPSGATPALSGDSSGIVPGPSGATPALSGDSSSGSAAPSGSA